MNKKVILVNESKLKCTEKWLVTDSEEILFAAQVKYKRGTRILIITTSAIAIINQKVFKGIVITHSWPLLDVKSVNFSNGTQITISFSEPPSLSFECTNCRTVGTIMLKQISRISAFSNVTPTVISDPPNALAFHKQEKRPPQFLLNCFEAELRLSQKSLRQNSLSIITNYDQKPNGHLIIPSDLDLKKSIDPFAKALGMDKSIQKITFHSYKQVDTLLGTFLNYSSTINEIHFENYNEDISIQFNLQVATVQKLKFLQCKPGVVCSVLSSFSHIDCKIISVEILQCPMTPSSIKVALTSIANGASYNHLSTLIIADPFLSDFSVSEIRPLISQLSSLKRLTLSHFPGDGTAIYDMAALSLPNLTSLDLTGNSYTTPSTQTTVKSKGLSLLDVSESRFTESAFISIMDSLAGTPDKTPLIIKASQCGSPLTAQNLEKLSLQSSIICEFDYSGNLVTADQFQAILEYLRSQSGTLKQVAFSGCWSTDEEAYYSALQSFITDVGINGFDLSKNPVPISFINELNEVSIHRIAISGAKLGDQGFAAFAEFASKHAMIEEIGCDGMSPTSVDSYINSLQIILSIPNLQCFEFPVNDFADLHIDPQSETRALKAVNKLLKSKRKLSTTYERITQYQTTCSRNYRKLRKSISGTELKKAKTQNGTIEGILKNADSLLDMFSSNRVEDAISIASSILSEL